MIQYLDIQKRETAIKVWDLQQLSYKEEAELINFKNIPYLLESVENLMQSNELFIGYFNHNKLIGMLAYKQVEKTLEINRLVVHPIAFRQGIASHLLSHLLSNENDSINIQVNTAKANLPAIGLYQKFGFKIIEEYVVENILEMVLMDLTIIKQ